MSVSLTKSSIALSLIGLAFLGAASCLPATWHIETIVPAGSVSSPDKNLIIARSCFILDGLWFLIMGATGWRWRRLERASLIEPKSLDDEEKISRRQSSIALATIFALALALRLVALDSSFWLDEITPLTFYRDSSIFGLLTTYYSTNNHLFYTLLEKLAVSVFGEFEWVVRLPSVVIGAVTVPVMYLLTRVIANRAVSLGAAATLALSYQHIFFSQNARGYTAHLLFTLAATLFLLRGVRRDKLAHWCAYCLCMFLNMASIIASLSVLIAHFLIAVVASILVQRRSQGGMPLFLRLTSVIFLALLMVLHLYSIIFPQAYAVVQETYHVQSTGFTLFSTEFLSEVWRGLKLSSGAILLAAAVPGVVIAVCGVRNILRCSWILLACLVLPEILLASYLLKLGLAVSPRFFLLALPLVLLILSVGLYVCCKYILARVHQQRRFLAVYLVLMVCVSLLNVKPLYQYYKIPKQDFRSAVLYLRSKPFRVFPLSIYTAREGVSYYANRFGMQLDRDYYDARSVSEIERILKLRSVSQIYLITTFPRALHLDHPELEPLIDKYWVVDKVFPGSIGDGDLTIWKPR